MPQSRGAYQVIENNTLLGIKKHFFKTYWVLKNIFLKTKFFKKKFSQIYRVLIKVLGNTHIFENRHNEIIF